MDYKKHQEQIIQQFSQQAKGYSFIAGHWDALGQLVQIAEAKEDDTVLDVACGSGIVACEFAKHVAHVRGIDITEPMLKEARAQQESLGLDNISWDKDDVLPLPYESDQFSIVISRFGFHHFLSPEKVMKEMLRVCKTGGRVMVVDVCLPEEKLEAYNKMEKLRDLSHSSALSENQFEEMISSAGLNDVKRFRYSMKIGLDQQLEASFPTDKKKLKEMIIQDIGRDKLGISATKDGDEIYLHYPIHIYCGKK